MSRHAEAALATIDAVLEEDPFKAAFDRLGVFDNETQQDDWGHVGEYVPEGCIRCEDDLDEGSVFLCRGCKLFMHEISDEDPAAVLSPLGPSVTFLTTALGTQHIEYHPDDEALEVPSTEYTRISSPESLDEPSWSVEGAQIVFHPPRTHTVRQWMTEYAIRLLNEGIQAEADFIYREITE